MCVEWWMLILVRERLLCSSRWLRGLQITYLSSCWLEFDETCGCGRKRCGSPLFIYLFLEISEFVRTVRSYNMDYFSRWLQYSYGSLSLFLLIGRWRIVKCAGLHLHCPRSRQHLNNVTKCVISFQSNPNQQWKYALSVLISSFSYFNFALFKILGIS